MQYVITARELLEQLGAETTPQGISRCVFLRWLRTFWNTDIVHTGCDPIDVCQKSIICHLTVPKNIRIFLSCKAVMHRSCHCTSIAIHLLHFHWILDVCASSEYTLVAYSLTVYEKTQLRTGTLSKLRHLSYNLEKSGFANLAFRKILIVSWKAPWFATS